MITFAAFRNSSRFYKIRLQFFRINMTQRHEIIIDCLVLMCFDGIKQFLQLERILTFSTAIPPINPEPPPNKKVLKCLQK
jgi:hypothetical protein